MNKAAVAPDPRARHGVGIDGRHYARKPPMYIDVLGIGSLAEAVEAASEMLRRGIVRAMSSNVAEPSVAPSSKVDKPDRLRSQSAAQPAQPAPPARRDPVSVYSAVTKRARKPSGEPGDAGRKGDSSPVIIVREKIQKEDPRADPSARGWSSTKKAGPSILSKRPRSQSSLPGAAPERVFQPAPKREKSFARIAKKPPSDPPGASSVPSNAQSQPTDAKLPSTTAVTAANDAARNILLKPMTSGLLNSTSILAQKSAVVKQPFAPKALASGKTTTRQKLSALLAKRKTNSTKSPVARTLPASWGQVGGNGFQGAGVRNASVLAKNSILRKQSADTLPKVGRNAPMQTMRDKLGGSVVLDKVHLTHIPGLPSKGQSQLRQTTLNAEALIPVPSASNVQVKYVPGSKVIDGVRPNGYTISREGIVKPVVTFNPKPKLPHKLRQTSVEKLFEGLRDVKELEEAIALSTALETEQELYAKSKGRVDYRAAVTTKLKEIKK